MKRRLKEPFGKAGLTVAILALVMAMVGGAYAAGGLTKSQEKQVTKIAKKYAGKPGATGPTGAAGSAGPAGSAGKNGTNGTNGTNGKEGSPWTAAGVLPSKQTETGTWSGFLVPPQVEGLLVPVSFNIPLGAALPETGTHIILPNGKEPCNELGVGGCEENPTTQEGERSQTACLGIAEEPEAKPGNLCFYIGENYSEFGKVSGVFKAEGKNFGSGVLVNGASKSGAILEIRPKSGKSLMIMFGAWAVTAP
jgi:hypothetical protein